MKNNLFTLLFALLASTSLFAIGRNDGSNKANAIDFDWEYGVLQDSGTKWYRLDLTPLYAGANSLRFNITNPSNTESVDITCMLTVYGQTDTILQTIAPQSSFDGWDFDPTPLIKRHLQELFFVVSSTGDVQLSWYITSPSGDSCEDAKYYGAQNAGTKWYSILAPDMNNREFIDRLVIDFRNWEGDSENNISVSFMTDCNSPAFNQQTFTIPLNEETFIHFSAEMLAALGWPDIVFSCTSSSYCEINHWYEETHPGESCFEPISLVWDTVNQVAGTEQWYSLPLNQTILPDTTDVRLHFTNIGTQVNSITAEMYLDCLDPAFVIKQYQLAPAEDYYIDIDRDLLKMLGWAHLMINFASDQDTRVWAEPIFNTPRETLADTIVAYVDYGDIYHDPITNIERVILRDTTWNDTVVAVNGLSMVDSVFLLQIYVIWPEANYSTIADTYNMAHDSTFTLGAFEVVYTTGAYYYIKDATGSGLIYKANYGLQAGDHVEAGMAGKINIYRTLYEIVPTTAKADLTITPGEAFEPAEAYETPSASNVNQYVIYRDVTFATDTAFASKRHAVYGVWDNQSLYFYNQFMIGATLQAGKRYNITAFNGIYNSSAQAWPISVEEVNDTPTPCLIASGTCGDNLTWELSCDSVLTISGTGAMTNFFSRINVPWYENRLAVRTLQISDGVTTIGNNAFYECSSLISTDIPNSVTSIGEDAFTLCYHLTSVTIPNSVIRIEGRAFYVCYGLTSVTIPSSVTSIGYWAFADCVGLTAINVDVENPNYSSLDGVLFNKDKTTLIQYPIGRTGEYTIPNGVTSIEGSAFYYCDHLASVTIPNGVTSIGESAFSQCSSLTSITIPSSVINIGDLVFSNCAGLLSVTNKATTPQTINANVFMDLNISACTLYVHSESITAYQAADVWKDFGTILPIEGDEPIETIEADYSIVYIGQTDNELSRELVTLHVPVAPIIEGFSFLKWQVVAGDLEDGIVIEAVYTANDPSSVSAVYTTPANPAQKLIRNGNVYILKDDKVYMIHGQKVK